MFTRTLQIPSFCVLSLFAFSTLISQTKPDAKIVPDYSKEAYVVEKFATDLSYDAEGTGYREITLDAKVQSESGVREFGLLSLPYEADSEKVELEYVRVRKADGSMVETPPESVQDVSSDVTRTAPMYSDLRGKQIPVKGLGAGDRIEYRARFVRTKPQAAGHFWYSHNFIVGIVVREETLTIRIPSAKYVQVQSPKFKPDIREADGQRIYRWQRAQLDPTPEKPAKSPPGEQPSFADVQVTTFKDWAEVGQWYGALARPQAAVTTAIQTQAAQLTRGLATDIEIQQAIYSYVATKFRYVSLSFGTGRYRPHTADEVLSNQYGDCKDKHTLLAALLKAAGYEAWPVLVGVGMSLDDKVPSPGQFNHLITLLPNGKEPVWLDATTEVAPFGMLQFGVRDRQTLVIPNHGAAELKKTPQNLPFPAFFTWDVKGSLAEDGVFTGHFDVSTRGDAEMYLRMAFNQSAQTQWPQLLQNMSYAMNFSGSLSNVDISSPDKTEQPLHYSYDYQRKDYSDWANHRVGTPFPALDLPYGEDTEAPVGPFPIGSMGESIARAKIALPKGYAIEIPGNVKEECSFASYSSNYSVSDNVLSVERRLIFKTAQLPAALWPEYVKFQKGALKAENRVVVLTKSLGASAPTITLSNPEAEELVSAGYGALVKRDFAAAQDAFAKAQRIKPDQRGLWSGVGMMAEMQSQPEKAIEDYRKELLIQPDNAALYKTLARIQFQSGHQDDGIETYRKLVTVAPDDLDAVLWLTAVLRGAKRYSEALEALRSPLEKDPHNSALLQTKGATLLYSGARQEGAAILKQQADQSTSEQTLNEIAWDLASNGVELPAAKAYSEKSIEILETALRHADLSNVTKEDLRRVASLAAYWDTLGWIYFQTGDNDKASDYLHAAWILGQDGSIADHLGQFSEKRGNPGQAVEFYRMALAANIQLPDAREHLRKLGVTIPGPRVPGHSLPFKDLPTDELSKMRTVYLPDLVQREGSAEFFVSFVHGVPEDARFISGSDALKAAGPALLKAHYDVPLPDQGPEKIVRRGIVSCSRYTHPACMIALYTPTVALLSAQ